MQSNNFVTTRVVSKWVNSCREILGQLELATILLANPFTIDASATQTVGVDSIGANKVTRPPRTDCENSVIERNSGGGTLDLSCNRAEGISDVRKGLNRSLYMYAKRTADSPRPANPQFRQVTNLDRKLLFWCRWFCRPPLIRQSEDSVPVLVLCVEA